MRLKSFIGALLFAITLAVYWPATHFDLIYFDDPLFVTETPEINSGINCNSLIWAFTSVTAGNWHPVTNLSFLFTHQFFGANAGIEHGLNTALHALNGLLLFLLLLAWTTTDPNKNNRRNICSCAAVAAIFAWHPLHVESVVWIAERKDVLSCFFFLVTLLCYTKTAIKEKAGSGGTSLKQRLLLQSPALLAFALGLLSKSMLVTVPLILFLIDFWPLKRLDTMGFKRILFEKIPYVALSAVFCVITLMTQKNGAFMPLEKVGVDLRAANVIASYLRYLAKCFWPSDLAILYPFPTSEHSYLAIWQDWQLASAVVVLVLLSIFCWLQRVQRPYLAFGWFWYVITLLPVIGIVQVGGQGMADRYTYIPLIGPAIALVWWSSEILRERIFVCVMAIIMVALPLLSRQQLRYWQDTVTLFTHTVDVTGDNLLAQLIIGDGFDRQKNPSLAAVHYRIAISIAPNDVQAYRELGRVLGNQEKWLAAEDVYNAGLLNEPHDVPLHLGLAMVESKRGHDEESVHHLETALQYDPDNVDILNNLAWALAAGKREDLRNGSRAVTLGARACALTHYKKTIFIGTLAAAYAEAGQFDEAVTTAERAVESAEKNGEKELAQRNRELMELYRSHQALHETN